MLQKLNYTENPVDIPNPDRGAYRGRWQRIDTVFGVTPEVDHRVPVDENSIRYHGATLVSPGVAGVVHGDDIEETEFFNGTNKSPLYLGGTGISAMPSISFMGFDLCNFSSNAFLSREAGLDFDTEFTANDGVVSPQMFEGRTGKTGPLTGYALDFIRDLLQQVRDGSGVALVKFSYDGNGFNYVEGANEHLIYGPEPTYITPNNPSEICNVPGHTDKNWIEYHIWQLSPIFHEFEDIIMCVKTGMVGAWGEQHTSPVSGEPDTYKYLLDAYLKAVPASRSLLTHAGGFLAWYNATYKTNYNFFNIDTLPVPKKGSPEARFGFFNDSYAAGYSENDWSDNGSLSEGGRMLYAGDDYGYDRYRLINWIKSQNNFVQGEGGLAENIFSCMPGAIIEAIQLRTTALNMRHGRYTTWNDFIYNEKNITAPVTFPLNNTEGEPPYTGPTATAFFDPVYDGKTGLEYFRDRMGYRLVLREAYIDQGIQAKDGILNFNGKMQNVGFGNIINKKRVSVLLQRKGSLECFTAATDIDPQDWLVAEDGNSRADNTAAWRNLTFAININLFGDVPPGEYDIFLKINDPKETSQNKRCIQFANHDMWNPALGANLIGSTTLY